MLEAEINSHPALRLYPVLIMYNGPVDDFNTILANLPPIPTTRQAQRWNRDGADFRAFTTWMSALDAWGFQRTYPAILGISFEPRLRLTPPPPPLVPDPPDSLVR